MKFIFIFLIAGLVLFSNDVTIIKARPDQIVMHWKDSKDVPLRSFGFLFLHDPEIKFATNGGMFAASIDHAPLGLYVEDGKKLRPVNKVNNPRYNFGMQPQGVFLVTKDNIAKVVAVSDSAVYNNDIKYAVQSAPMLVIGGKINPLLTKSSSANIRNGVGVLRNGNVLLIVDKNPVTFQQFAKEFIDQGCVSAMYLDGAISNGLTRKNALWDGCECYGSFIGVK